jgi:hypothetical protein
LRKKGGVKVMECNPLCQLVECIIDDGTLANSIKQSTQQGGKEGTKEKYPSLSQKNRNPKGVALFQFVNIISLWSSGQLQSR